MAIYRGDSDCEVNPVKVEVPLNYKVQGIEHLAIVLQKFDWTKCSVNAIPAKVNGKPIVAIVDTMSWSCYFNKLF